MIDILTKCVRWFAVAGTAVVVAIIAGSVDTDCCRSRRSDAVLYAERPLISESFDFFVSAGEAPNSRGMD